MSEEPTTTPGQEEVADVKAETTTDVKVEATADVATEGASASLPEAEDTPVAVAETNVSSKSSDISIVEIEPEIEDIGAEPQEVKTDDKAEVIVPEPEEEKSGEAAPAESEEKPSAEKSEEEAKEPSVSEPHGVSVISEMLEENDDLVLDDDEEDEDDDDDDFEDETLMERLIGLTEMFPDGFTDGAVGLAKNSASGVKWLYDSSRSLTWVVFSTASILFLPVIIETQLLEIEEAAKQQQRQILLGPGSAVSAGQNAPLPKAPV